MSILQEYEKIRKDMGSTRYDAIGDYLEEVNKDRDEELFLSDVLYKEKEYKKYETWFNKLISPFRIHDFENGQFSVSLDQSEYWYDWNEEIKSDSPYGDGHCYNDAFYDYLGKVSKTLNSKLNYDSENGMFCVYTDDIRIADEVAYKLSQLYKDEDKMIELIKDTKANYGYVFDVHI